MKESSKVSVPAPVFVIPELAAPVIFPPRLSAPLFLISVAAASAIAPLAAVTVDPVTVGVITRNVPLELTPEATVIEVLP